MFLLFLSKLVSASMLFCWSPCLLFGNTMTVWLLSLCNIVWDPVLWLQHSFHSLWGFGFALGSIQNSEVLPLLPMRNAISTPPLYPWGLSSALPPIPVRSVLSPPSPLHLWGMSLVLSEELQWIYRSLGSIDIFLLHFLLLLLFQVVHQFLSLYSLLLEVTVFP